MKTVHHDFKPGDRVSLPGLRPGIFDVKSVSDPWVYLHGGSQFHKDALTLVSRPVYPEPGQVVVALDADEARFVAEQAKYACLDHADTCVACDHGGKCSTAEKWRSLIRRAQEDGMKERLTEI